MTYILIAAVITQIFNPIAELVIPIGIPAKEEKAEIIIHPVIVFQYDLKLYKPFYVFYSSVYFALFLQVNNFLFHLYFAV